MTKDLAGLMRTHNCGELTEKDVGSTVSLCGWVNKVRDLGGLYFIDVRDKFGLTQLNFEEFKGDFDFKQLSLESVIRATGKVSKRPEAAQNKNMGTGLIEIAVTEISILSKAQIPPFLPNAANQTVTEDLKLKYRYLEIRNQKLQEIIAKRSQVGRATREVLYDLGFIEVDTPILYKTTPEGARDYIVPSRVHPGKVYALPQSPQTLKQLLMIGGTDKYFQLCRCFRDEDLRADRQPEFTQVDIETSFSSSLYMKNLAEKLIKGWFPVSSDFVLEAITFEQAMNDYGSDKPDVRTKSLKQYRVNELFATSDFGPFKTVGNGLIKAMFLKDSDGVLTRKEIDGLIEIVKPYQGKAVYWFKAEGETLSGGMSKFITPEIFQNLKTKESGNGVWFLFADADENVTHNSADAVRRFLITKFPFNKKEYAFLWVYDFPLLEFDDKSNRFVARHHPFTRPLDEDMPLFLSGDKEQLKKCRAEAYDVVCNGYEIGGGSMRIFNQDIQSLMFKALGMTEEETLHQFGFFIEALKYGTPPHGGIAFGFDRLLMLIAKTDNIRDVIAFPKTTSATDLMASAPSGPNPAQLRELHFNWNKE